MVPILNRLCFVGTSLDYVLFMFFKSSTPRFMCPAVLAQGLFLNITFKHAFVDTMIGQLLSIWTLPTYFSCRYLTAFLKL